MIFNGRGLESWTDNIEKNIDPNKTLMVGASMGMDQVCGIDLKLYPLPLTEKQKENIAKDKLTRTFDCAVYGNKYCPKYFRWIC